MRFWVLLLVLCGTAAPACLLADESPDWTTPIAPFRIADNLYYVGSRDLASYLIVTPSGDILINSSLESSPGADPQKRRAGSKVAKAPLKVKGLTHGWRPHYVSIWSPLQRLS